MEGVGGESRRAGKPPAGTAYRWWERKGRRDPPSGKVHHPPTPAVIILASPWAR